MARYDRARRGRRRHRPMEEDRLDYDGAAPSTAPEYGWAEPRDRCFYCNIPMGANPSTHVVDFDDHSRPTGDEFVPRVPVSVFGMKMGQAEVVSTFATRRMVVPRCQSCMNVHERVLRVMRTMTRVVAILGAVVALGWILQFFYALHYYPDDPALVVVGVPATLILFALVPPALSKVVTYLILWKAGTSGEVRRNDPRLMD
jgi:hypothetical protein